MHATVTIFLVVVAAVVDFLPLLLFAYLDVMSHSIIVPPVHETSPPPLDDDIDDNDNDVIVSIPQPDAVSSNSANLSNDANDDWKSMDENDDQPLASPVEELPIVQSEPVSTDPVIPAVEPVPDEVDANDAEWANFATFEPSFDNADEVHSFSHQRQCVHGRFEIE